MFSLLVALTMYLTFARAQTGLAVRDYAPRHTASLPLAASVRSAFVPTKKDESRLGIQTTAKAATVLDWRTGATLYEKDADEPMPIASITKLLTALVVLDQKPDWEKVVEIRSGEEPSGGIAYLVPGEQVTVADLFNLSLIASSNGATLALARSTGLSDEDFASKMNAMAERIGMTRAHFVEPTGLDPQNRASARSVAMLIRAAFSDRAIQAVAAKREYRFTAKTGLDHAVRSTDELLGSFLEAAPYAFLGGKTGFIQEAGYCFGAAAENADHHRVVAVVLDAPSKENRFREVKALIYWAFDAFRWPGTNG